MNGNMYWQLAYVSCDDPDDIHNSSFCDLIFRTCDHEPENIAGCFNEILIPNERFTT